MGRAAGPMVRRDLPRLALTRRVQVGLASPTGVRPTLTLRSLRPLHASALRSAGKAAPRAQ
eukprot:8776421-Lingulodinium_polyedra.AAC.1